MTFQTGWLACSQSNFQTEQTAAEGRGVYSTEKGSVTAVSSTQWEGFSCHSSGGEDLGVAMWWDW